MQYKTIKPEELESLLKEHNCPIVLEYENENVQNVRIALGDSHFKIAVGTYSVSCQVPVKEVSFKVTVKIEGENMCKSFDSKKEAEGFVKLITDKYQTIDNDLNSTIEEITEELNTHFLPCNTK